MNLFKIVQKKTDKSNRKNRPYRDVGTVLLFVFLLPYVISFLWGHVGEETEKVFGSSEKEGSLIDKKYDVILEGDWGSRTLSMQEYLIRKLKIVMGEEGASYELEALKAQAVLLRTQLWALFSNAGVDLNSETSVTIQDDISMYNTEVHSKYSVDSDNIQNKSATISEGTSESLYEKAVCETDGIYLSYDNQPVKAAFFPLSNGYTRDASQVWENISYPYLVSVECSKDIMSGDYQSQVIVSKDEYCRIVEKIYGDDETIKNKLNNEWDDMEFTYDTAGYVIEVKFAKASCSGERFRSEFGLNSASFQAEWNEDEVIFHVKGMGHGFGMSQYGANERAISGESFEQILKYYFFQTELAKIE
ncbi:MAG: SpoIID/LytB domain-containing protein [Lachnospiraceae bacterium]|nr:SpoIID/LytB domain-containing protein [Lachnospiraceae bacterium]